MIQVLQLDIFWIDIYEVENLKYKKMFEINPAVVA